MTDMKIGFPDITNASLVDLKLRAEAQNLQKLQNQSSMGSAKNATREATQKAAEQFEGLLIQQMLKSMWETVPQGGLLTGSQEEMHYRDMLNQAYSEELAKGQGIGIKEVIMKEMEAKKSKLSTDS